MTMLEAMGKLDETDFRMAGKVKFPASELAVITLCCMICGGTGYRDFAKFAEDRKDWLRTFLKMRNGIPSHDTFRYFWRNLAPARFNACFMEWLESASEVIAGDSIHIDGKCLRRAVANLGKSPCIVSAYSSRKKLVIGQVKTEEKSNEITAIPQLLQQLYLAGAIVTIDAAGCQKRIVRKIVAKNADYFIALKKNQQTMHEEVEELFNGEFRDKSRFFKICTEMDKGHGRLVKRTCTQTGFVDWFEDKNKWAGLRSFCKIETETTILKTGVTTKDCRYFISSLDVDPKLALKTAVQHWDIENPLHWTLDMVFDEDHSRVRTGFAVENLAIMRHFAFDLIRLAKGVEGGIANRKKSLSWSVEKLTEAIVAA